MNGRNWLAIVGWGRPFFSPFFVLIRGRCKGTLAFKNGKQVRATASKTFTRTFLGMISIGQEGETQYIHEFNKNAGHKVDV